MDTLVGYVNTNNFKELMTCLSSLREKKKDLKTKLGFDAYICSSKVKEIEMQEVVLGEKIERLILM